MCLLMNCVAMCNDCDGIVVLSSALLHEFIHVNAGVHVYVV